MSTKNSLPINSTIMNILVIKFGALGDLTLTIPALRAIKRKFPQSRLSLICREQYKEIFEDSPEIDNLILWPLSWKKFPQFFRQLNKTEWDILIDFQNNKKSALLSAWLRPRVTLGYQRACWHFLVRPQSIPLPRNSSSSLYTYFEHLLAPLNCKMTPSDFSPLSISPKNKKITDQILRDYNINSPFITLHAGAAPAWNSKKWPLEYFLSLATKLTEEKYRIIFVGGNDDPKIPPQTPSTFVNMTGKLNLQQLADVIARSTLFIGGDSGPLHLAATMKVSLLALFGPTNPSFHAPKEITSHVLWKDLSCSPCYEKNCPIGTQECLSHLHPQEVFNKAKHILSQTTQQSTNDV